jgi:D-alanyl-D-alanine carboxypeptidase (penicillin-binding protein 5/6)
MHANLPSAGQAVHRFGLILLIAALCILAAAGLSAPLHAQAAGEFVTRAKRAILMDADSGAVLYQFNADELAPPASMSKLMTLEVLFNAMKQGKVKPEDEFLMSEYAWRASTNSSRASSCSRATTPASPSPRPWGGRSRASRS